MNNFYIGHSIEQQQQQQQQQYQPNHDEIHNDEIHNDETLSIASSSSSSTSYKHKYEQPEQNHINKPIKPTSQYSWWWLWLSLWLFTISSVAFFWMEDNVWCKIESKHDAKMVVQFAIENL